MINDVSHRPDVASRPLGRICDSRDFPGATTSLPSSSSSTSSSRYLSPSFCLPLCRRADIQPAGSGGRCRTSFSFGTSIGIPAVGERFRRDNLRIYRRVGRRAGALFRDRVRTRARAAFASPCFPPRKNARRCRRIFQARYTHGRCAHRVCTIYISNVSPDKGYMRGAPH